MKGKRQGPPPKKGPSSLGLKIGIMIAISKPVPGCPHREGGVKSDIKGISDVQVKGKKFIGVK
jgi:hypothetical protein